VFSRLDNLFYCVAFGGENYLRKSAAAVSAYALCAILPRFPQEHRQHVKPYLQIQNQARNLDASTAKINAESQIPRLKNEIIEPVIQGVKKGKEGIKNNASRWYKGAKNKVYNYLMDSWRVPKERR